MTMAERTLTLRELNRATLARQLLLQQAKMPVLDAVRAVAGLQGQLPNPPYIGLWSRLADFERGAFTRLLEQRQVVRTTMMRNTLHVATVDDYLHFYPALHPIRMRAINAYFAKQNTPITREQLLAEFITFMREKPRTNGDLRKKINALLPGLEDRLIYDLRSCLASVQVFPAGSWGVGGSPAYAEATGWLARTFVEPEAGLEHMVRRYLAAFGPASIKDMQMWSGLKKLSPAVETLRPTLRTFRDELGNELFDLLDAPLPAQDTPTPIRFVPDFDNLVLAHFDRRRVIADEFRPYVFPGLSMVRATFLVDGFVAGAWKIEEKKRLVIEPFITLPQQQQQGVSAEGERLMRWILNDGKDFNIEWRATYGIGV